MDTANAPATIASVSVPQETQIETKESIASSKGSQGDSPQPLTIKEEVPEDQTTEINSIATDSTNNVKENLDNKSGNHIERKRRKSRTDNSGTSDKKLKVSTTMSNVNEYSMLLTNFPKSWTCQEIHKYVSRLLEGVDVKMEPEIGPNKHGLRLTFAYINSWKNAQEKLKNIKLGNNILQVEMEGPIKDEDSDAASDTTEVIPPMDPDIWEKDPKGLYGLKLEYLATLNITPPIGKWVHITNFRCDKSELRDVFELAGNVVVCSIINSPQKYAKVMYSHPLEAVQAVSMLNNRVFYGQKLNVKMDNPESSELMLPKGLASVGPGLGEDGDPIREIAKEYERFLDGKSTKINVSLFEAGNVDAIVIPIKNRNINKVEDPPRNNPPSPKMRPSSPNVPRPNAPTRPHRPFAPREPIRYGSPGPMFGGPIPPLIPGEMHPPMQYTPGFLPGRMPMQFVQSVPGPISAVSMTGQVPGVPQPWMPNAPLVPQMFRGQDPTTLRITNLPPTTSFPSLCGKLSTLAQVTSLEFTTPGCAVVRFASPGEAEKCFQKIIGAFSYPEEWTLLGQ